MEHRIGRRIKANVIVELWQGNFKRGDFELLNIGPGGLFLKGRVADIREGEVFTIKSAGDDRAGIIHDHLIAMVVHQSKSGLGLMWAGGDSLFFSRLSNVLNQAA